MPSTSTTKHILIVIGKSLFIFVFEIMFLFQLRTYIVRFLQDDRRFFNSFVNIKCLIV